MATTTNELGAWPTFGTLFLGPRCCFSLSDISRIGRCALFLTALTQLWNEAVEAAAMKVTTYDEAYTIREIIRRLRIEDE